MPDFGKDKRLSRQNAAVRFATDILNFRRSRGNEISPDIFAEPAWDLLLELYVAQANDGQLTTASAIRHANVPSDVISRWVKHLAKLGYIHGFEADHPENVLTLSDTALQKIGRVLQEGLSMHSSADTDD